MIESICDKMQETLQNEPNREFLHQENACLRAIIVDLLIKNQKLRWAVQRYPQLIAGS